MNTLGVYRVVSLWGEYPACLSVDKLVITEYRGPNEIELDFYESGGGSLQWGFRGSWHGFASDGESKLWMSL